jgi:hypothetical protein
MKKRLGIAGSFYLAAVAAGAIACTTAQADVKYTESVKMDMGAAGGGMNNSTTTFIADGAQRIENVTQYGPVKMNDITVTVCAKKKTYKIDPDLKIYTATDITEGGHTAPARQGAAPATGGGKKGTGKISSTVNVKYLGEETLSNRKCRHYLIETAMKMEGCAGDGETHSKMEIWVTDYKLPVFDCGERPYETGMPQRMPHNNCDISFEQHGDTKAMADAYRGLIMRMKMYSPGQDGKDMVITREVTGLYDAKLPASTFEIPADYKLVSDQDFQKARSDAMMKGMMSGAGAAGGHDNNGDANDNANANDDQDAKDDDAEENKAPEKEPEKPKKPKFKLKLPF